MHKFHFLIAALIASQFACAFTCKANANASDDEPAFSSKGVPSAVAGEPPPTSMVSIGDAFGGYMDVKQEIDDWRYSPYSENDPFSSGLPPESLMSLSNGTIGPGKFWERLNVPRLEGATNGTIGNVTGGDIFTSSSSSGHSSVRGINKSLAAKNRGKRHLNPHPGYDCFANVPSSETGYQPPNLYQSSEPSTYASELIGPPAWRAEQMPLRIYISKTVEGARRGYVQNVIYETLKQSSAETRTHVRFQITYKYSDADIIYCSQTCEAAAEQTRDTRRGVLSKVKIAFDLSTLWEATPQKLRRVCLEQAKYAFGELGTPAPKMPVLEKPHTATVPQNSKLKLERPTLTSVPANIDKAFRWTPKNLPAGVPIVGRSPHQLTLPSQSLKSKPANTAKQSQRQLITEDSGFHADAFAAADKNFSEKSNAVKPMVAHAMLGFGPGQDRKIAK